MQRTVAVAITTVAALATGAVLAVTGGAQDTGGQTIKVITKNCSFKFVDAPPRRRAQASPPGSGDSLALSCPAETTAGERVGNLNAACDITKGGRAFRGVCTGIYRLGGGQIHIVNSVTEADGASGSVVGGTGVYAGARGTFISVDPPGTKDGDPSEDTITLLP